MRAVRDHCSTFTRPPADQQTCSGGGGGGGDPSCWPVARSRAKLIVHVYWNRRTEIAYLSLSIMCFARLHSMPYQNDDDDASTATP